MADRNPYVIGVPLTESAAFYGRKELFKVIKDVLDAAKQNVIVMYGQRRIGKTSVLHRAAKWLEDQGSFFPVYYDLQGKESLSLGEVLENLAQTLARRLELPRADPERFDDDGIYFGNQFLSEAFKRLGNLRLVLLVDEFDVLSDELESAREASKTLFPYLQELIVTRPQIGFVFVVGRRIEELAMHFQAIFKQAVFGRVGHLRPEESRELIVQPARGMIVYTEDAVREIQSLAAGHPYFTQLICFEAFNAVKDGDRTVTAEVIEAAMSRAIESGHGALNWFWEGLPRAERFILSAVAQASDSTGVASKDAVRQILQEYRILLSGLELKDAPDRLVEWEMLNREGPEAYRFGVEIVRRWVAAEHPLSSARRDIDHVSKRAVRLFENARDAHSEGELPYARDEYRRTLNANPNHSGAQLGLALVLFELGDIDESIGEFLRAYAIDEMSARDGLIRARLAKAKILEEQNLDDAVAQYEQVLQLSATEETSIGRLGAIWQSRAEGALAGKDLAGAMNAYRTMFRYDERPETLLRMQRSLLAYASERAGRGEIDATVTAYTQAAEIAVDPEEVRAAAVAFALRFGEAFQAGGPVEEALVLYERILALFPGDAQLLAGLEAAREEIAQRQNVNRIFNEARVAHRADKMARAQEGYKKLIQLNVLSYEGENIGALLAETVVMSPPEPEPEAGQKPKPPPKPEPEPPPELSIPKVNPPPGPKADPPPRPTTAKVGSSRQQTLIPQQPKGMWKRPVPYGGCSLTIFVVCGVISLIVFVSAPAYLVGFHLPATTKVQVGRALQLQPVPVYDISWRRKQTVLGVEDYLWRSDDDSVATVSAGMVTGVGPGQTRITAWNGGMNAETAVTVSGGVILPMKASFKAIRFFRAAGPDRPAERTYETRFRSTDPGYIFAELVLDLDEEAADRELKATIVYRLTRSDGSVVEEYSLVIEAQPSWKNLVRTERLEFEKGISPDTYRLDFRYDNKSIGSATFVVQ